MPRPVSPSAESGLPTSAAPAETEARLRGLIAALYPLDRDLVSAGYDRALEIIGTHLPLETHRYPSGTTAWSWTLPDRWELRRGWIERLDGTRVIDSEDCALHVARYSQAIDREVCREELLNHVYTHPIRPDAIPYIFFFYREDWGFCLTEAQQASLGEARYRVVIDAERSPGEVAVGEVRIPGSTEESVTVVAHLDHPWQVNDDLTGVVAGVEVFRRLLASGRTPRYTWRLLILPETIGSVAWLAAREKEFVRMHGAVFVEMLGRGFPHRLQRSFQPAAHVDLVLETTLRGMDPEGSVHDYRTVIGNDERQFNGPGVRVPCASLSRVRQPVLERNAHLAGRQALPFDEYHSHLDDPAHCDFAALTRSAEVLWQFVEHMEEDALVLNHFQGEIFLSRFGIDRELEVSWYRDPVFYKVFFDIMDRIDGSRTVSQIAAEAGTDFATALRVVQVFERHGLASRATTNPPRLLR